MQFAKKSVVKSRVWIQSQISATELLSMPNLSVIYSKAKKKRSAWLGGVTRLNDDDFTKVE